MRRFALTLAATVMGLVGCAPQGDSNGGGVQGLSDPVVLGPADGQDLPGTDLERVQVGALAPDFSVASLAGPVVSLSDFRGEKNVILVFYRGYW